MQKKGDEISFSRGWRRGGSFAISEHESAKITEELDNFINGEPIDEEDVSFYRERNPLNIDDYLKFNGQVRNPLEPIFSDDESYFGEDEQPDLYAPEKWEEVTFGRFLGF